MAAQRPDQVFKKTKVRGLQYRERGDGSRSYYGYVPGRGRVKLDATAPRAAEEEYRDLRGRADKGEKIAPSNLTFRDVAEEWIEQKNGRLAEWTRRGYREALDNHVLPTFGHRKLREIDHVMVARFISSLESKGLKASTIESYLKPLAGTFKYAVWKKLIATNPMDALRVEDRPKGTKKKQREWTRQEIADLLWAAEAYAKEPGASADYVPLLRTAVYAGLRLGELLGLQWQDVDFEHGAIHVERQFNKLGEFTGPKTQAGVRRIPVRPELIRLLKDEREKAFARGRARPEDLVFSARTGGPKLHRTVQRAFDSIADKAGVEDVTFHDLRHAYASIAIDAGADPVYLAKVLGHADPAITLNTYAHVYDKQQKEGAFRTALAAQPW